MSNLQDKPLQTMYLPNGGDPTTVDLPSLQMPGMLGGSVIIPSTQGNKKYRLVQIDSSATNTPAGTVYNGSQALWSDRDKYKVGTAVSTLGRGNVAGVFTYAAAPGNYTCIQTKGYHGSVKLIDAPTASPSAAGAFIIPSATNGKADCLAAGSASTYPSMGLAAGTVNAGDQTCPVNLDVPELP